MSAAVYPAASTMESTTRRSKGRSQRRVKVWKARPSTRIITGVRGVSVVVLAAS